MCRGLRQPQLRIHYPRANGESKEQPTGCCKRFRFLGIDIREYIFRMDIFPNGYIHFPGNSTCGTAHVVRACCFTTGQSCISKVSIEQSLLVQYFTNLDRWRPAWSESCPSLARVTRRRLSCIARGLCATSRATTAAKSLSLKEEALRR